MCLAMTKKLTLFLWSQENLLFMFLHKKGNVAGWICLNKADYSPSNSVQIIENKFRNHGLLFEEYGKGS